MCFFVPRYPYIRDRLVVSMAVFFNQLNVGDSSVAFEMSLFVVIKFSEGGEGNSLFRNRVAVTTLCDPHSWICSATLLKYRGLFLRPASLLGNIREMLKKRLMRH